MTRRVSRNGPGSITPALSARIKELAALGWSSGAISDDLGGAVSRQAIDYHRKVRKLKPATSSRPEPAPAPLQVSARVGRLVDAAEDVDGVEEVRGLLESGKGLLELIQPGVEKGEIRTSEWTTLAKFVTDQTERLEAMKPKPPPDPETDPANVEATKRLVAKFTKMVEEAEKRGRWVPLEER